MSPLCLAVIFISYDTLLALVSDESNLETKLFRDDILVASFTKERIDGLELVPALFMGDLREVGGCLVPMAHKELYLNAMDSDLKGGKSGEKERF